MEVITAPTLDGMSAPSPPLVPALGPGEVLKTSGKFAKPTKIAGKNYCKDEVVIRNSDSGKGVLTSNKDSSKIEHTKQ